MSLDRKDLKIQALRERLSSDKAKYEDEIADLRVELTIVSSEKEEIANENSRLAQLVQAFEEGRATTQHLEVLDGEVLEDVQEEK